MAAFNPRSFPSDQYGYPVNLGDALEPCDEQKQVCLTMVRLPSLVSGSLCVGAVAATECCVPSVATTGMYYRYPCGIYSVVT